LEEALAQGCPEVFNTDPGVRYTSASFTGRVEAPGAQVSRDGKGRCLDHVFVERLWRTVQCEEVYRGRHETARALAAGWTRYFGFDNRERRHPSLEHRTPAAVYGGKSRFP
jgi:putative transposase